MSSNNTLADHHPEPELISIPIGSFMMGSRSDEPNRDPDEHWHEVRIQYPFALGKYPVTFAEYDAFCTVTERKKPSDIWGRGRYPVINVTWYDAMAYCQWLSALTGQHYRLPSEAEWEYACRAGTTTAYYCGDSIDGRQAVFQPAWFHFRQWFKAVKPYPVGQWPANPWGLHDMHGNVWEWTGSAYNVNYSGSELEVLPMDADPRIQRVMRGGAWINDSGWLRSAQREHEPPNQFGTSISFRIARSDG